MPNLGRTPSCILQSPVDFQERAFSFMFELDLNGKCRLKHSDAAWETYKQTVRIYWKSVLRLSLKQDGSIHDYATACKVFKLDLRELLSAESPEQTPRPPASQ